jgi:hypothetical protein
MLLTEAGWEVKRSRCSGHRHVVLLVSFAVKCRCLLHFFHAPQIEFGANQVILVRSTREEGLRVLPDKVRRSNALTMEVLQSKGLEFEDGTSVCLRVSSGC